MLPWSLAYPGLKGPNGYLRVALEVDEAPPRSSTARATAVYLSFLAAKNTGLCLTLVHSRKRWTYLWRRTRNADVHSSHPTVRHGVTDGQRKYRSFAAVRGCLLVYHICLQLARRLRGALPERNERRRGPPIKTGVCGAGALSHCSMPPLFLAASDPLAGCSLTETGVRNYWALLNAAVPGCQWPTGRLFAD